MTKIDATFPNQQFKISDYEMFRRDKNKHDIVLCFTLMKKFLAKQ